MKIGVLGQQLEFLVQNFQTFLGNLVGTDVVDGNLQPLEAGSVQSLNAVRKQQIAVGDQAGDHAVVADVANHVVELWMQQWVATGDGDNRRAQLGELVHSLEHFAGGHGLGDVITFVAVGTCEVATANGKNIRKQRVIGGSERTHHHARSA